ncbi:8071_t:CDS:10 [Racocetra fulgida]|uniref:8071_t:CDS:1 n=1 Tax=Racocetra fulgida TaxID=60492 RepID=A0A9N8WB20_9GLOM|nr:8071_t:CDS:10 [Racocetra fulgida]
MAEEEIELLEKVELRLALAETDAQLEKILNAFLSPILLKLASPHEVVRTKVMSVLTHINKRTRSKSDIKLPLNPLLDLVCTDKVTQSAFVKNFAILYLEMAYFRLTEEVLQKFKSKPADSPSSLDPFNFAENLNDAKFLLASFLDVILYNVPQQPKSRLQQPTGGDSSSGQQEVSQNLAQLPPPDSLPEEIHLAKFLILLVASCDSVNEIVDGAQQETSQQPASPALKLKIIADEKLEIREMALRNLAFPDPRAPKLYPNEPDEEIKIPSFSKMVNFIDAKSTQRTQHLIDVLQTSQSTGQIYIMGYRSDVYINILRFLRHLMIINADPTALIDDLSDELDGEIKLFDPNTRTLAKAWIKDQLLADQESQDAMDIDEPQGGLHIYLRLIEKSLKTEGMIGNELKSDPARISSIQELIKELIAVGKDQSKQVEHHDGSILALGYIIGRLTYRYPSTYQSIVPANLLSEIMEIISEDLNSTKNSSVINASKALGETCRYTSLLFENYDKGKGKDDDSSSYSYNLTKILEKLITIAKTTKDVKETAIAALGHIALGNSEYTEKVLSLFYYLSSTLNKQVEVHFTVGEAITYVTTGWESLALNQYLDIADSSPPPISVDYSIINGILNKIFSDLLPSGKAAVKKAGIGLVYELGDENMRKQLVDSLVDMLSEGKRQKETINADTQLFDSNTLGQTPDGSAISTYQSILSLASDMNQPELVYKFMQLASYNAMWQSRKGAAFGFSFIIAKAEKELEPYLKDLIPRLYRFQYDPNPKVNDAMSSIWKALVKEPKKAIEEYFDVIVKDLLKVLSNNYDLYVYNLKESVRVAAFKTCRALTKITVKYCDPDNVSIDDDYLSFHVEKYDVTQEQNSRLSAAKMSPMMEGIESCIDYIDESVMVNLTPKLLQLVRKGVGLPTKAGCARFLVSLCFKKASILKPHADTIMKALSGAILDTSPAVRKSYAVAVGYVAHLSSDNTLIRLIGHLKKVYCENNEQEIRSISGITALEISRHASDELKRIYVEILPLAYYGLHDSDTGIKNVWNEVWDENTAGSTSAIKLYLKELIDLLSTLLESPSWQTKRQAAATIADVAKIIEKSLLPYMTQVIPLLMNGLSGRTWVGKEALVEALVTASISCKEYFDDDNTRVQLNDISKILVRESKKTNKLYKRHCIDNLGRFADSYIDILDLYTDVKEFLIELATGEQDPNEMDEDDANQQPLFFLVKASAMKCLGLVWPRQKEIQELGLVFAASLESSKNIWNVRLGVLASLDKYIDKLDLTENDKTLVLDEGTLLSIFNGLKNGLQDAKYVAIRTASLESFKKVSEKVKDIIKIAESDPVPGISELAKDIHRTL